MRLGAGGLVFEVGTLIHPVAQHHLSRFTHGAPLTIVPHDPDLAADRGAPYGSEDGRSRRLRAAHVLGRQQRRDGSDGFGLAVHVHHDWAKRRQCLAQLFFRHGRGRIHEVLQSVVPVSLEFRRGQQHVDHGRRQERNLYLLFLHRPQDQGRIGAIQQHVR